MGNYLRQSFWCTNLSPRYLRQIFSCSNWSLLEDEFDAPFDSLLESAAAPVCTLVEDEVLYLLLITYLSLLLL